MNKSISRNWG